MVAALNNQPDVIVILLFFALEHYSTAQFERGIWTRDSDQLTAAHLAIGSCNLECISVLLYLYPKFADDGGDFRIYPSLYETLKSSKLRSKDIQKILSLHGKVPENVEVGDKNENQKNGTSNTYILSIKCCDYFINLDGELNGVNTMAMLVITAIPKPLVFLCMRIIFFYSVYIFIATSMMMTFKYEVFTLHILGILSTIFLWLLYSKLCDSSPGSIPVTDSKNKCNYQISGILHSDSAASRELRNYDNALNLLYAASSIAHISSLRMDRTASYDSLKKGYCCHHCRIFQPLHSRHSLSSKCCIPNYDHYCIFLQNHIGRDNYPYFVGSLVTASGLVLPLFLFNIYSYSSKMSEHVKLVDGPDCFFNVLHNSPIGEIIRLMTFEKGFTDYEFIVHLGMKNINLYVHYMINRFFVWCCIWWMIFVMLLVFHIYLMCLSLTTREFIDLSKMGWLNINRHSRRMRKSYLRNISDKLFLRDHDICYTQEDVDKLSLAVPLSWVTVGLKLFYTCVGLFLNDPKSRI